MAAIYREWSVKLTSKTLRSLLISWVADIVTDQIWSERKKKHHSSTQTHSCIEHAWHNMFLASTHSTLMITMMFVDLKHSELSKIISRAQQKSKSQLVLQAICTSVSRPCMWLFWTSPGFSQQYGTHHNIFQSRLHTRQVTAETCLPDRKIYSTSPGLSDTTFVKPRMCMWNPRMTN